MDVQTVTVIIAAIGVLIAAINQIYTSREANKQRQMQLFNEIYGSVLNRDFRRDYEMIVYSSKYTWENLDDWNAKFGIDVSPDDYVAFMNVFGVLAYISEVVNKGYVDIELFEDLVRFPFIAFWDRYGTLVEAFREQERNSSIGQDVERMYYRIKEREKLVLDRA